MGGNKILVTGATGLVGGNLTRLLVGEQGEQVKVLVRQSSKTLALDDLDVERVQGDITDPDSLVRAMQGCDRVFHAAGLVSTWNGYLPQMRQVNSEGTANVMQAAMDAGVQRVVHVSTNGVIGMRSRENPSDETVPFDYAQYGNAYSLTKREAHDTALAFAKKGLDVVIGCPTYMFGAWDVRPTSGTMIIESKAGKTLLYPSGGNNIVDVLDVCHGLILACEKGQSGEAYLLANADGNLSYGEIFTLIAETIGSRKPLGPLPRWLSRGVGLAADLWGRATNTAPEVNAASIKLSFEPQYFTPQKAIDELGLPQSPVADAIRRAYDWFCEHGYIRA
ncbi:MAG: SDR family oxidoreductase [Candidatus Alcyoniella australis]|nr:SDR family oxidoreductase [Candidatus Alcyoniella australis]